MGTRTVKFVRSSTSHMAAFSRAMAIGEKFTGDGNSACTQSQRMHHCAEVTTSMILTCIRKTCFIRPLSAIDVRGTITRCCSYFSGLSRTFPTDLASLCSCICARIAVNSLCIWYKTVLKCCCCCTTDLNNSACCCNRACTWSACCS